MMISLDLSNGKLASFDPSTVNLDSVIHLNLSGNGLTELLGWVLLCNNLIRLTLSHNKLTRLPSGIASLSCLYYLRINNNRLQELPAELIELANLKWLHLENNQLKFIPAELGKNNIQFFACGNPQGQPRNSEELKERWQKFISTIDRILQKQGDRDAARLIVEYIRCYEENSLGTA